MSLFSGSKELRDAYTQYAKERIERFNNKLRANVPDRQDFAIMSDQLKELINKNFGTHFSDNNLLTYKQYMQKDTFRQLPPEHQEMFKYLLEDLERVLGK